MAKIDTMVYMTWRSRVSSAAHRYLRIPYGLHTYEFQSPKKPRATYIFIHGIGNTLHSWDDVVARMPRDVRIIGIDLLGFGESPKPDWVVYNAKTQARSVALTLLGLGLVQQPIIVGHSLGALIAVEIAKRYPLIPKKLVLCSPPFYQPEAIEKGMLSFSADDTLRSLYRVARRHPEQLERMSPLAVKLGLANKALSITNDNVASYVAALEASIINQTSLEDVARLKLPIKLFVGVFDPVVIRKHLVLLAKNNANITLTTINAGHEVIGGYSKRLAAYLSESTASAE